MGEVWAATHVITRRRVAMKFLKGPAATRADMRQRMLREARAASVVNHPSVVKVLDVFELEGGVPVLVMDLLVGETLAAKLAVAKVLPAREVATLLLPVVEAVEAAHAKGIVHRDLKPDNIFLGQGKTGDPVVKVLDFGIAKLTAKEGDAVETGALTGTGTVVGTPWYMAPEQCYGERDIDQRADVWALGVILYECLAGVRPVEGASMGQVLKRMLHEGIVPIEQRVPGVPPELAALMRRMLSQAREQRPRDLTEVRQVLSEVAGRVSQPAASIRAATPVDVIAPARADTDGSHAVPGPSESRARASWRLPVVAFALSILATVGFAILYSAGRGQRDASTDLAALPRESVPAAATSRPGVSSAETLPEVPSSSTTSAASAASAPVALPVRSLPTEASGPRVAPARSARHATDDPMRAAHDAGSAALPSSASAPANALPPRQKTPEGRLFEDVPF
jgi:serine/threonine-protein kinase